jgi:predicted amidophosphoribosyltransferase
VCENAVVKVKETPSMKNIPDWFERQRVLGEAVKAGPGDVKGKTVLLLDDLVESGSTLRRAADVLLKDGAAGAVYALGLTRTR